MESKENMIALSITLMPSQVNKIDEMCVKYKISRSQAIREMIAYFGTADDMEYIPGCWKRK